MEGMKDSVEKGHLDHVRGFKFEMKVLNLLKNWGRDSGLNLKLFHDIPIQSEKLEALCNAFGLKLPDRFEAVKSQFRNGVIELELDVIAFCCGSSICLFEVKSSFEAHGQAKTQLQKSESIVHLLLEIAGVKGVPVKKVVAVPRPEKMLSKEKKQNKRTEQHNVISEEAKLYHIKKELKKSNIDLLLLGNVESAGEVLQNLFQGENVNDKQCRLSSSDFKNLIAALVFLRCSNYFPFDREKVFFSTTKLEEQLLESSHAKRTVSKLDQHSALNKSKHPQVEGIEAHHNSSARFLWMQILQDLTEKDPKKNTPQKIKITSKNCELREIKYSDFPKTVKNSFKDDCKILIILPYRNMVKEYRKNVEAIVSKEQWKNILITTPKDDWISFTKCPKEDLSYCQIFVHESAESEVVDAKSRMDSGLAPALLESQADNLFIWLDPFQMKIFQVQF